MNNIYTYLDNQYAEEISILQKNKNICRNLSKLCYLLVAISIALWIFLNELIIYVETLSLALFFLPFGAVFSVVILRSKEKKYTKQLKEKTIKHFGIIAFKKRFEVTEHNYDSHIAREYLCRVRFSTSFDRVVGHNHIKGNYKGHYFEFSEVLFMKWESHAEGARSLSRVFEGPWFVVQFNIQLAGEIFIRQNNKAHTIHGSLGSLKKLKMDHESFDKKFTVFTDNENLAKYILTPDLLSKILVVSENVGNYLHIALEGGRLYFALNNNGDAFNVEINQYNFSDSLAKSMQEKLDKEIANYANIIDIFLDTGKVNQ